MLFHSSHNVPLQKSCPFRGANKRTGENEYEVWKKKVVYPKCGETLITSGDDIFVPS